MTPAQLSLEFGPLWALAKSRLPALLDAAKAATPLAAPVKRTARTQQGRAAVIPLRGVIMPRGSWLLDALGGTPLDWFTSTIEALAYDPAISEIIIDVDSPGGSVSGVQEASNLVRDLRERKPITAVANTLMASAAYWIASAASKVVASSSAELGSIGVYALHLDYSEANKRAGVAATYIVSAGSPRKTDGNPDAPLSAEARADIQASVDEIYQSFLLAITRNRGKSYGKMRTAADGRVYSAKEAVALGLADSVGTLREVLVGGTERRMASAAVKAKYRKRLHVS